MQCPRCGNPLSSGQTFCLCGCRVDHITGSGNGSSAKSARGIRVVPIVIIAVLALAILCGCLWVIPGRDRYLVTHENQWETIYHAEYSMTIPSEMRDGTVIQLNGDAQTLGCYTNNEVCIAVAVTRFTKDQQAVMQSVDFRALLIEQLAQRTINNTQLQPVERGKMIYVQYPRETTAILPHTDRVKVTNACFLSDTALYEVEIYCAEDKYYDYESCIFAWLDSFSLR